MTCVTPKVEVDLGVTPPGPSGNVRSDVGRSKNGPLNDDLEGPLTPSYRGLGDRLVKNTQ